MFRAPGRLALAAALLALSGCSGAIPVYALLDNGSIALTVEPQGGFMSFESCVDEIAVTDANGDALWAIARPGEAASECENDFPFAYGQTPPGFELRTEPALLQPGTRYRIDGRSPGVHFYGDFAFLPDGTVINYASDEEIVIPEGVYPPRGG